MAPTAKPPTKAFSPVYCPLAEPSARYPSTTLEMPIELGAPGDSTTVVVVSLAGHGGAVLIDFVHDDARLRVRGEAIQRDAVVGGLAPERVAGERLKDPVVGGHPVRRVAPAACGRAG